MNTSQTVHLDVVGEHTMHCGGCERTIEFTLALMAGVDKVNADQKTQHIEVHLSDDALDTAAIQAELEWLGYETAVTP